MAGKIDVHIHALPDFFRDHLIVLGQAASGIPLVEWSVESTKQIMSRLDIGTAILSLSAPGAEVANGTEATRALAREYNDWAYKLRESDPPRFGFFAALPSLYDTEGCLAEIAYIYDTLKADGVCIFTSYSGKYIGEEAFEPVWNDLNLRQAVVIIHPTMNTDGYKLVAPYLQPPAFDFAHETGRTAAHFIMTGMKRRYSDVKIILSHAGGTLPVLSERLAQLESSLFSPLLVASSPRTSNDIIADAKSYYFDLALTGTSNVLDALLKWAPKDHVLFGSDFPYATTEAVYFTKKLAEYPMSDEQRKAIYENNGRKLFPRPSGES